MTDVQKTILDDNYAKCTELQIQISNLQKELKSKQLIVIEKDNEYKNLLVSMEKLQNDYDKLCQEKATSDDLLRKMVALNQSLKNKDQK